MKIVVDASGTATELDRALHEVAATPGVQGLLVLSCAGNGFARGDLDPILESVSLPLVGGLFPAILSGNRKMERGTIVVGLPMPVKVLRITGLNGAGTDFTEQIDAQLERGNDSSTVLVLVDAFAGRIDRFLESVYTVLGPDRTYVGGGAGSLAMDQSPCLLTNRGMTSGEALVLMVDTPSFLGVSHGWRPLAGPFQVTEVDGVEVKTLDWNTAFTVYRDAIREAAGREITEDTFFEVAKAHPFGISRMQQELVVRDPFSVTPDGSLVCVGAVPKGAFIHILEGDEQSLISAAGEARDKSRRQQERIRGGGGTVSGDPSGPELSAPCLRVFFDCISRVLFLGDRFAEELQAVHSDASSLVGACSIGEVANSGDAFLEFYNKTAVVADIECG